MNQQRFGYICTREYGDYISLLDCLYIIALLYNSPVFGLPIHQEHHLLQPANTSNEHPPPTLADLVDADCDDGAVYLLRSASGQSDAGQRGDCFGEGREGIAVRLGA